MAKTVDDLDGSQRKRFDDALTGLAMRVRSLRLAAGLSGRALAQAAGIGHANSVAIESGTTNVTFLNIFALAEALGVELRVLLEGDLPANQAVDPLVGKLVVELKRANRQMDLRRDAVATIIDELQEYLHERASAKNAGPRPVKKPDR